jgi:D-tyrosyl-tRNA(Tyr) deacylase
VVQRVRSASVEVDRTEIARIGPGLLALVAVRRDDSARDLEWMAHKIVELRIFEDAAGKMNLGLLDVGGELLVVSQFTLYGDVRGGRRPSFTEAAPAEQAETLYARFVERARADGVTVATGRFRAHMALALVNDGPVTLVLDTAGNA